MNAFLENDRYGWGEPGVDGRIGVLWRVYRFGTNGGMNKEEQ